MGAPRRSLDWHGMPLLAPDRPGIAGPDRHPVVVVTGRPGAAAAGGRERVADRRPGRGPLEGIAAGLDALAGAAERRRHRRPTRRSCIPAFLRGSPRGSASTRPRCPVADGREHPLAAAGRLGAGGGGGGAAADRLRVRSLLAELDVAFVDARRARASRVAAQHEHARGLPRGAGGAAAAGDRRPAPAASARWRRAARRCRSASSTDRRPAPGTVPLVDGDVVARRLTDGRRGGVRRHPRGVDLRAGRIVAVARPRRQQQHQPRVGVGADRLSLVGAKVISVPAPQGSPWTVTSPAATQSTARSCTLCSPSCSPARRSRATARHSGAENSTRGSRRPAASMEGTCQRSMRPPYPIRRGLRRLPSWKWHCRHLPGRGSPAGGEPQPHVIIIH